MGKTAAEQRRQAIWRMLTDDPARSQESIGAELGVSQSQVQRDVADLRRRGVLPAGNSSGRGRPAGTVVKLHVAGGAAPGAGEELVAAIRAEMDSKDLEPDAREEGLLLQIRQVADDIAELRERIAVEGLTFPPATRGGPPRMHPAVAEVRQARSLLGRLLAQIFGGECEVADQAEGGGHPLEGAQLGSCTSSGREPRWPTVRPLCPAPTTTSTGGRWFRACTAAFFPWCAGAKSQSATQTAPSSTSMVRSTWPKRCR